MRQSQAIIAALAFGTITASPMHNKRQEPDWAFSVYQTSPMCTGARDGYSGNGSLECTRGVFRNGEFSSYTNNGIREGCTVFLYDNDECLADRIIDVLEPGAPVGCQQPAIVVDTVPAYSVECD